MNLGAYESELSITRELLDNKLLECSEKLNKNPNDYQTLTELITISIYSGLNESALEFIATMFETLGLPNLSVSLWFSNILKEGFANSSIGNFQTFKKIANNELKRIFLKFKIKYHNCYSSIIFDEFS